MKTFEFCFPNLRALGLPQGGTRRCWHRRDVAQALLPVRSPRPEGAATSGTAPDTARSGCVTFPRARLDSRWIGRLAQSETLRIWH
jgi:hypothetical protein